VVNELLCFHAQQAAEKAIKAVLIARGIEPPRTHSITALVDLLPADIPRPNDLMAARTLTSFAAVTRYPGQAGPVSEEDYHEAVRLAEAVVAWAEDAIAGRAEG
jgi:HEPN domain-containing protein